MITRMKRSQIADYVASLDAENRRLREALRRARPIVSGYERASEHHLKWLDEALGGHPASPLRKELS